MPSKNPRRSKQTAVSEIKLELPSQGKSTATSLQSNLKQSPQKTPKVSKPSSKDNVSEQTVSVQNLQFPEIKHNKHGAFKVENVNDLLARSEYSPSSSIASKERGYDFTSSTNSHYHNWLISVPKKTQTKCYSSSTSSTDERRKSNITETIKTYDVSKIKETLDISQEMVGSNHENSPKRMNFHGSEWRKPCKESFVAGAPQKFIGTCPNNYEKLSKMSKARQKMFLTQDPRKVHCLVNPDVLRTKAYSKKTEFNALTKMVKHAQNVCAATASESSEDFICEVIDLENPLQLDFQGLDYANTYQKDEQDLQNQRNYNRVCRYMERRRVKAETGGNVEAEIHNELANIPKRFDIRDRDPPPVPTPPEEPLKLGKLFRSVDKPCNQKLIKLEKQQRTERYKDLYLRNKERAAQEKKVADKEQTEIKENLAVTLANKNFQQLVANIDDAIDRCTRKDVLFKKPEKQRRTFPHTMKETVLLKRKLKQKNRVARDEAKVKREFFKNRLNKEKDFPAADLEISSDTPRHSSEASKITEQSTDDEDNMSVGKSGSKFKLRGFQFKLSSNLRGKLHQREKLQGTRQEKTCKTRDQWLKELAPKKEKVKLDIEMGIQKIKTPDDPQLVLFPPPFGFNPPEAEYSAIEEYRVKPLGRHYDRVMRKNLKFAKPRLRYSVKKFNLISYHFGDTVKKFSKFKDSFLDEPTLKLKSTNEYMKAKALKKLRRQMEIKQKRLQLLGIPCKPIKKSRLQTMCENSSSSSDSDWVPEREPLLEETEKSCQLPKKSSIPLRKRCNMPAPKYREPTLRQHPRHPRDYDHQRIPSDMFDEVVLTTAVPHMHGLPADKVKFSNVASEKKPYTDMFEGRHHHDHWNPTQVKQVDVHYQAHVVKPEVSKVKRKSDRVVMENFRTANPPCNQFVDMNLTLPEWDIDEIIKEHKKTSSKKTEDVGTLKTKNLCTGKDFVLNSRDPEELKGLDYPGRQEYLQLLKDVQDSIKESKHLEEPGESLFVDKAAMLKELDEDLQSIESCLTSLSSSQCTNLTNDSGSFLLMEGTEKIPLDFIRKSVVPFEELQRSRFRAIPIDVAKEEANPFQVMPFSGQSKAQLELTTAKDSFFTFTTRLKNGLRLRLEVPVEDVREKFIGRANNKYKGLVTTDIDENYVDELNNRPPIRIFNFKTGRYFIKDALRLKFESMLIQGQMVRTKIFDRLNDQHWSDMQKVKILFEKLFAKWEKREYEASMAIVYKVKHFYDETDLLKSELRLLEREQVILNMDIVFIEGHWIRCIMLQNFHYLLGDQEWRVEHDWIHRLAKSDEEETEEVELENFEESIAKRSMVNIRAREKDDAWAIKTFYEDVYMQNIHPILQVFPNAESFLKGLENLKSKTFVLLLEMHFTLAIHTELQSELETFVKWCAEDLKDKEEYVVRKCAKLYFMEDRAQWLRNRAICFLDEPIDEAFNDETFNRHRALISEAWRRIVPTNMRGSSEEELHTVEMAGMISTVIRELIYNFESVPVETTRQNEIKIRARRAYLRKQSYQAYHTERRIEMGMKKVVKNLEPPYQKPKRTEKLPRYYIKKRRKTVVIKETTISERAKFFFRAFHDEGDLTQTLEIRDSITQVDNIQEQIVPFYFDYFLKINGYTPNYNFKTQTELRDGPEMDRLKIKSVLPEIQERVEQWEVMKKTIMEENIAQNPKMYVDVIS